MSDKEIKQCKVHFTVELSDKGSSHKECLVEEGSTIVQAAYLAGVTIQQTCGGTPSCTDCKVRVLSPLDASVYPADGPESRLMGNVSHITKERLACQTKIRNDSQFFVPLYTKTQKIRSFQKGSSFASKTSVIKEEYGKSEKEEKNNLEKSRKKGGETKIQGKNKGKGKSKI
jgi:ferredoxin